MKSCVMMGTPRIGRHTARALLRLDRVRREAGKRLMTADVYSASRRFVDQVVIVEDGQGRARYYVVCLN